MKDELISLEMFARRDPKGAAKRIQAAEEEIALQKGMRQNLDNEIFELNKEIARLREALLDSAEDIYLRDNKIQKLTDKIEGLTYSLEFWSDQ